MEKLKDKINSIRLEAEAASTRADAAETALKQLSDQQVEREQEIISLQNKVTMLEEDLERKEERITEAKQLVAESETSKTAGDALSRRINMLEEKLEETERELQQTKEQLRNIDIKSETLERTVAQMETDKAAQEAKYDEINEKYLKLREEHEETLKALDDLRLLPQNSINFSPPASALRLQHSLPIFPRATLYSTLSPKLPVTIQQILNTHSTGSLVEISGWVKHYRKQKNVSFICITDGSNLNGIQVVVDRDKNLLLPEDLSLGCSVKVSGTLIDSPGTNQLLELLPTSISVIGAASKEYPFQKKNHSFEYTRSYEHLRPRLDTFKAISQVRNEAMKAIHKFYQDNNFIQIHTPILTTNNCEGGSETFSVISDSDKPSKEPPFFGKNVNLSVSGQLHLEAACCAHSRVYNFNPVFRAETSLTSRHLSEFWMVEAEVSFLTQISQLMDLIESSFCSPIKYVLDAIPQHLLYLNNRADPIFKALKWSIFDYGTKPFNRITYCEAISILESSNKKKHFKFTPKWGLPLQTEHELYLANTYFQAPVFVYNYPKKLKPFYMKSNGDELQTVGCVDLLVPGLAELVGGSLREDNYDVLYDNITKLNPLHPTNSDGIYDNITKLNPLHPTNNGQPQHKVNSIEQTLQWYLDLRKYGTVPHGGYGLGFDRFVQLLTGVKSIRDVAMFARYFDHCNT
ncbi:hypothetical protein BB561_005053 [Smittium simulii]|uniref:asparagine--tRNA ligase n=1 Tax=Smittium simulii TaxID=133385 RepID=A0A2T9YCG3_9FUNG|nr:hypothetical protein BB561_005053 [Smittium simulii]